MGLSEVKYNPEHWGKNGFEEAFPKKINVVQSFPFNETTAAMKS